MSVCRMFNKGSICLIRTKFVMIFNIKDTYYYVSSTWRVYENTFGVMSKGGQVKKLKLRLKDNFF